MYAPIVVTLDGIVSVVIWLKPTNKFGLIVVTELGIVSDVTVV